MHICKTDRLVLHVVKRLCCQTNEIGSERDLKSHFVCIMGNVTDCRAKGPKWSWVCIVKMCHLVKLNSAWGFKYFPNLHEGKCVRIYKMC